MNLEVSSDTEEISKVLTELRYLVKDVILPELIKTKEELRQLREETWPICQSLKETSQISDITTKKNFLNNLEQEEIIQLLKNKNIFSRDERLSKSTCHLLNEEVNRICLKNT